MRNVILAMLIMGVSFALQGCAQTTGGDQRSNGNPVVSNNSDPITPNTPFGDPDPGNTPAFSTTAASDQDICAFLRTIPTVSQRASRELQYLCDQGQLQKVKGAQPVAQVVKSVGSFSNSEISIVASAASAGKIEASQKLATLYCSDFNSYRKLMNPKVYEKVASIATQNASGGNCDYVYTGTKIAFLTPSFRGRNESFVNSAGNIMVGVNYLTQSISLVKENVVLLVIANQPSGIRIWNITTSISDPKGFHGSIVGPLTEGTKLGVAEYARVVASQ